uniref:MAM domain-containing protein n=1 Tax=Haemonchus contortus TaxID=6289 RepID=A0A7I4XW74_HAECO
MRRVQLLLYAVVSTYSQEFSPIDCDFQHSLCGWEAEEPWRLTESTFIPSLLNLNPIMLTGDGSFMTAQGHFGSNTTADLVSPLVEPSPVLSILSLKYTKVVGNANLQIIIKEGSIYRILDTISSNSLVLWIRRTLVVPATIEPYQIVLRVNKLRDGFDTISIDDVLLLTTAKNVMSAAPLDSGGGWDSATLMADRELRRSPTQIGHFTAIGKRQNTAPRCKVKCSFKENACSWSFANWKLINGKIITEAQPDAWLESEPVLLPLNAHFEFDMSMSDSSSLSVYQKFGAEENLIWMQSGVTFTGWNRIRLPIRFSPLPSKFLIKTSTRQGQSVAVTNTNIVDGDGRDLACGGDLEVIRPRSDNFIRLTAIQKLDPADNQALKSSKLFIAPTSTLSPLLRASRNSSYGGAFAFATDPRKIPASPVAALPISPSKVSISNPQRPSSIFHTQTRLYGDGMASNFGNKAQVQSATTSSTPIVALTKKPSIIQELMSRQPLLKELVKHLSKKYGFDDIPDEQVLLRLPQVQRFLSGFDNLQRHPGNQPIQPQNFLV